jgi:chemotaxis protein MotB
MARKKKEEEQKKGAPRWMITFSDLSTLLLTFFVLIVSMSVIDKKKVVESFGSFKGSPGLLTGSRESVQSDVISTLKVMQAGSPNKQTTDNMNEYLKAANLSELVTVIETPTGVAIRVLDSLLFGSGSADINREAIPFLKKLGTVIIDSPYYVHVEGHTDDIPSRSARFPSNWELSTARAVNVVKFFIDNGVNAQKMSAGGFAEFHPLLPNITNENRAKNRRIEINLVSPEFAEVNKNIFEE